MKPWEKLAREAVCGGCRRGLPIVLGPFGGDQPGHDVSNGDWEGWVACEFEANLPSRPITGRQLADLMRQAYELGAETHNF